MYQGILRKLIYWSVVLFYFFVLSIDLLSVSGSKKQIPKAFKHLIRLYASYSFEVVSVLVQLLLNGSDSKSYQVSHSTTHVQSLFDDWKPVVKKLSNKEPELLLNLIKAVLEKIETQEAMEYESGNCYVLFLTC